MALPVIPLIISLDNNFSEKATFISQKFGKGGVTDLAPKGINPINLNIQIKGNVLNRQVLEAFLRTRGISPFRYDYDGQPHPEEPFFCAEYEFQHVYSTVHEFSAVFQRIFRHLPA